MPRLEDTEQALLDAGQGAKERAQRAWDGFSDFALRDNVLEVAVGLIIAAAFTTVVTSFISDILLPPFSLIPGINKNLEEKFAVLRSGPHAHYGKGYNTLKQALEDGAVVLAYGSFLDNVLRFLGLGIALYTIAQIYGWMSDDSIIKKTVKCKYCRKRISPSAKRCVNCTSWQDGREG
ncbi:hypothetical protein MMC11_007177 [Xylographa trunciseda]|nr:hypothetical protein [Xylographa trunciseda]